MKSLDKLRQDRRRRSKTSIHLYIALLPRWIVCLYMFDVKYEYDLPN
jgi:hypothetical protein